MSHSGAQRPEHFGRTSRVVPERRVNAEILRRKDGILIRTEVDKLPRFEVDQILDVRRCVRSGRILIAVRENDDHRVVGQVGDVADHARHAQAAPGHVPYHAILDGQADVSLGADPVRVAAGDVLLFPHMRPE